MDAARILYAQTDRQAERERDTHTHTHTQKILLSYVTMKRSSTDRGGFKETTKRTVWHVKSKRKGLKIVSYWTCSGPLRMKLCSLSFIS